VEKLSSKRMKKKKVLITGAAGFIGSHTVDKFIENNFIVYGLDNFSTGNEKNIFHLKNEKNFFFEKIDLLKNINKNFIKDCDYIVHFAGLGDIVPSIEYPNKYFRNNFNGTLNLLNTLSINKVKKFIYAASSSCYGLAKTPTNEMANISPEYPYALSKYLGEQICFHWSKIYKLPVNSLRIFNAYGPRSRTTGTYGAVFGVFLKQLISNMPLTVVGNGNQKRDFLYISDAAEAFYKASLTKKINQIWNLGSGKPQSINYLCKLLKAKKILHLPRRPKEPNITWSDISKIKQDLNWRPLISFEKGVENVIDNIEYWQDAPLWNKNSIKAATKLWFKHLK
jgi:UDP-glucose 4-epimerase